MANDTTRQVAAQSEVALGDDELICSLTNKIKKQTVRELALQHIIAMLQQEYGFAAADMERDFTVAYDDGEQRRRQRVDLALFSPGAAHSSDTLTRFVVVAKDGKVKPDDPKVASRPRWRMCSAAPTASSPAGRTVWTCSSSTPWRTPSGR